MKLFIGEDDARDDVAHPYIPGEVLVKVQKDMEVSLASKLFTLGLGIHKKMNLLAGEFLIVQSQSKSIFEMIELLKDLPEVEYVEPNYTNQVSITQADRTQKSWEKFAVKEAAIEMIDSKINLKLPKIRPDIKVNQEITIRDLLFISDKVPVNLAEAVEAIDYATKREVNVISNTWVRDGFSRALDEALGIANRNGIAFVAADSMAVPIRNNFVPDFTERRTAAHVSAGILSLYIAHEGEVDKTGRGRLIAKSTPSEEEIQSAWNSSGATTSHKDIKISQDYSFPGAKFIKLEIEKFNSSSNIDLIILKNANGLIINNISGSGQNYETDYIETNLITVEFTSNATSTSIGCVIRNVKVIY